MIYIDSQSMKNHLFNNSYWEMFNLLLAETVLSQMSGLLHGYPIIPLHLNTFAPLRLYIYICFHIKMHHQWKPHSLIPTCSVMY